MPDNKEFTQQELDISADIIALVMRNTAMEFSFLQKAVYSLKTQPTDKVSSVCADYKRLYYNPKWVISKYTKGAVKLRNSLVHCILHSLYLHPSMMSEQSREFDTAADFAVFRMMSSAWLLGGTAGSAIEEFVKKYSVCSTGDLYELAQKDAKAFSKMYSIVSKLKEDDHSGWYLRDEGACESAQGNSPADVAAQEQTWTRLLSDAVIGAKSTGCGNVHGNMFMEIKKPDRFSRFSYLEYIRRFAMQEIVSEDPDTLDMMMYNWGMENLDDTPIVEFSEVREQCTASDIIIAIDMSGSCGGEVAQNFLRQVYTLFEQMNIRSSVNIHVVTFDTELISTRVIRSKSDADELINNYEAHGWGGTDFRCVFDYADNFSKNSRGGKLKGLFFFSDAEGTFPDSKPAYRTTFFVPNESEDFCGIFWGVIPDWVELVHYKD